LLATDYDDNDIANIYSNWHIVELNKFDTVKPVLFFILRIS